MIQFSWFTSINIQIRTKNVGQTNVRKEKITDAIDDLTKYAGYAAFKEWLNV